MSDILDTLSPEDQLILVIARRFVDETAPPVAEALMVNADPESMRIRAAALKVLPFVLRALKACPAAPRTLIDALKSGYEDITRRGMILTSELLTTLALFEKAGIRALPLKGPVLANSLYSNIAMRDMRDLDILVNLRDIRAATQTLLDAGYRIDDSSRLSLGLTERAYRKLSHNRYHDTFAKPGNFAQIELHSLITWPLARLKFEPTMWSRVHPDAFLGRAVTQMGNADLFLYLAIHGGKHAWSRLEWIIGAAILLKRLTPEEWGQVTNDIKRLQLQRVVAVTLAVIKQTLVCELPHRLSLNHAEERTVQQLAAWMTARLFTRDTSKPDEGLRFILNQSNLGDTLWERVRIGTGFLVHPNTEDYSALALPEWLFSLYYVLRPIRLARRHVRQVRLSVANFPHHRV